MIRSTLLGAAAICLAAGCAHVNRQDPQPETFSVLTYNIWHDQRDWPVRLDYMMEEIRELDPDVIGLQEVIQRAELRNQAEAMAEELGYHFYFSTVDPPEREQRYGNAILSRYPIVAENWRALEPENDYRTAAHVRIDANGTGVDVYNTHLHHTGEGAGIRATQIADLLDFISETRATGQVILMGDFNAAPDWEELQPVHDAFTDTFALFVDDPLAERHATLNHHIGHSMRRIDHVFLERVDGEGRLRPLSSSIVLDEEKEPGVWASDHFGVLTRFHLNP